jgi:hypothetical protein
MPGIHGYRDRDTGRVTVLAYARDWLTARTCDPATRQVYEGHIDHHIVPVLGGERLDQLAARPSKMQAFVAGLAMAPSTARQVLGTLSRILAAAVDDGLIPCNPCRAGGCQTGPPCTARLLFRSTDGNALLRSSFNNVWRRAAESAGLAVDQPGDHAGMHQLRHRTPACSWPAASTSAPWRSTSATTTRRSRCGFTRT